VESTQAQEQLTDRPNRVSQVATTNRGVAILHTQEGPYPGIGVGQILIGAGQVASDATVRVVATEKDQRIFYPAIEIVSIDSEPVVRSGTEDPNGPPSRRIGDGSVLKRLRKAVERLRDTIDPLEHVRIHFLFVGEAPLTIQLDGEVQQTIELVPRLLDERRIDGATPNRWNLLLDQWWTSYVEQAKRQIVRSDYPSLVERYLVYSLANRFGFPIPDLEQPKPTILSKPNDPTSTLELIAGSESLRMANPSDSVASCRPELGRHCDRADCQGGTFGVLLHPFWILSKLLVVSEAQ